ncbi:hypothetical protein ACH3XW_49035 [Acanthocheilonema viteae]
MFVFFTITILAILLPCTVTQWQCIFCYYPYNLQPYPYFYPDFYPSIITPTTYRSIGPCVNGQCPTGYGCYNSQCVAITNYYGQCINNQCPMGFCYNGQCVG